MKIHAYPYNDFVIPFLIGTILLFAIIIYKYIRWIKKFSPEQRKVIRSNWYSWKIFPAIWEMIREGLLHVRILKKNLLLGIMHQAYALGWFLLIVVGAIESRDAFYTMQHEQSIEAVNELRQQNGWHIYNTGQDKNPEYLNQRRYRVETEDGIARIHYHRPFYVGIFYRYFVHKAPASFRQHKAYSNLMDALLLYVFLGLTMAIIKIFWSKILGMRRTTKHTIIDRFSKFSLWMIFPMRLLAESITACLYGNGGFFTQAVGNLFDPMIVRGMETSVWMLYSLMLGVFFVTMPFTRYMHIFTELLLIYFRKIGVREETAKTGYTLFELNACSRCGVCISGCPIDKVLEITRYDEMQLDTIGDELTALFVIISDTDSTFNFLVAMMYSQMFNLLCTKADNNPDGSGKLKHHVRCLLDEFANIGEIPNFDKLIATIRSREISVNIILQTKSQLKSKYKDDAETIEGNCDTMLFLGGKEKTTLKDLSESLGKETIDMYNTNITKGQSESSGVNYQKLGRELKTQDELQVMDNTQCILQIRGLRPFLSKKYVIERHKRYSQLFDSSKDNYFDVAKYVAERRKRTAKISKKTIVDEYDFVM